MISAALRCVTSRSSKLALGLLGTFLLTTSVCTAQSSYAITNGDGSIVPAAAGLYTVVSNCYNSSSNPPATVCTWLVRKLYGDNNPVIVVIHQPNGTNPACYSGYNQILVSGYSRYGCAVYATAAVYGH